MKRWLHRAVLIGVVILVGQRAVHHFIVFGARSKASEARTSLKVLCLDANAKVEPRRYTYATDDAGVITASGNIDADPALDVWTVAPTARVMPDGTRLKPCEPFHEVEDVE